MPSKNAWLLVPRFIQFILTAAVFALALYGRSNLHGFAVYLIEDANSSQSESCSATAES